MNHAAVGIGPEQELPAPPGIPARPKSQVWAIALAAGVTAGLVSALAGELLHEAFKPELFSVQVALTTFIQPSAASLNAADLKNATLVFTILGGVTGAVMAIAGGLVGRSLSRGLIVGLGGLVAGAGVGEVASHALLPLFFVRGLIPDPNDLLSPVLIHSGIWTAIGAIGGLAFALGMTRGRRTLNSVVGGCFGALIATLLFHGIGEAMLPDSGSTAPLATSTVLRVVATFLVTLLIAFGAAKGTLGHTSRAAATAG
jgi:hypothetical protein